jgi:hypothetical protein
VVTPTVFRFSGHFRSIIAAHKNGWAWLCQELRAASVQFGCGGGGWPTRLALCITIYLTSAWNFLSQAAGEVNSSSLSTEQGVTRATAKCALPSDTEFARQIDGQKRASVLKESRYCRSNPAIRKLSATACNRLECIYEMGWVLVDLVSDRKTPERGGASHPHDIVHSYIVSDSGVVGLI